EERQEDPSRRREARPRRARPRREDHRAGAPRRRYGGDLHRPPPDARADRRDGVAGGRRRGGLSILSGAHMTLVPRVVDLLKQQGAEDVVVTVGGTIPNEDIPELKKLCVAEVFTPRASTQEIVDFIQGSVS